MSIREKIETGLNFIRQCHLKRIHPKHTTILPSEHHRKMISILHFLSNVDVAVGFAFRILSLRPLTHFTVCVNYYLNDNVKN